MFRYSREATMLGMLVLMSNRSLSEVAVEQPGFISAALLSQHVSRLDRGLCWKIPRWGYADAVNHSYPVTPSTNTSGYLGVDPTNSLGAHRLLSQTSLTCKPACIESSRHAHAPGRHCSRTHMLMQQHCSVTCSEQTRPIVTAATVRASHIRDYLPCHAMLLLDRQRRHPGRGNDWGGGLKQIPDQLNNLDLIR